MILFFHLVCLLARYIVSNISKSLGEGKVFSDDDEEEENNSDKIKLPEYLKNKNYIKNPIYKDGTLKFFPPVYIQRYETVALILKDPAWGDTIRKVVDFGCAELGFFMYLKNIENINEILEVDVDSELLQRCAHKAAPLTCDYLMNRANRPLDVYVLSGNIAEYDDCLLGSDAVIGIELIEHLNEEDFINMPHNVFNKIRPKLAIFTTPNADFNSLFPNFKDVRHDDHRFEWTRKEFFDWTQKVIKHYPEYSARFYGIGAGPEGTENLGCCSQMVVFQRSDDSELFSSAREGSEGIHNYKLIKHYQYPFYVDERTTEEKIIHEIQYQVAHFNTLPSYYNYETNESEIPLSLLREYVVDLCSDEEELRKILISSGMVLRKRKANWFLVYPEIESSSHDEKFRNDDWLNEEDYDGISDNENVILEEEVSWDDEFQLENIPDIKCARSLGESDMSVAMKKTKDVFTNLKNEAVSIMRDEVKSAPQSCNRLVKQKIDKNGSVDEKCEDDDDDDGSKSNCGKSRIPVINSKRSDVGEGKHSPVRSVGKIIASERPQGPYPAV